MNREKQILDYIKQNPYISQQELAEKVGVSRPAVANYIKKLIQNGEIKGRAYILNDRKNITCIGGANIDRKARSKEPIQLGSSNPVKTEESLGGVARNVAENLVRLGCDTSVVTFVGQDKEGDWILNSSQKLGMDISHSVTIPNHRTGTYTALIDETGEMVVSMADMDIYDQVTSNLLENSWNHIASSKAIFMDTNIHATSLQFIIEKCHSAQIPLYVDPVSSIKAQKLPNDLSGIDTLMPNQEEAELLSGVKINDNNDCIEASKKIRERGVNNVIITLGGEGIYYSSKHKSNWLKPPQTNVVDVTGAGDAFAASLIYGMEQGQSLEEASKFGLAGASLTLQVKSSVSPFINDKELQNMTKEF
ncbi:PfkB family carbohydrate kinase [Tenuibacillus multivorans]|uniref:PfkB family carbohydrate kinase n=1 Tax=Tenuibacillus multivorans TaxID=237069 RepID=UPI000B8A5053|nr:PfkB family carbohydrate kinase [Tenuibacillus multivorans]